MSRKWLRSSRAIRATPEEITLVCLSLYTLGVCDPRAGRGIWGWGAAAGATGTRGREGTPRPPTGPPCGPASRRRSTAPNSAALAAAPAAAVAAAGAATQVGGSPHHARTRALTAQNVNPGSVVTKGRPGGCDDGSRCASTVTGVAAMFCVRGYHHAPVSWSATSAHQLWAV